MCDPMSMHEIVLPETKPETEWILGRAVQKSSRFRTHSRLQVAFVLALSPWSGGRGEVGTEWRFRIAPPGEIRRPLVPDVSYVSFERLRGLAGRDLELPPFAPTSPSKFSRRTIARATSRTRSTSICAAERRWWSSSNPPTERCGFTMREACASCTMTTSSRIRSCPGFPFPFRNCSRRPTRRAKRRYASLRAPDSIARNSGPS
jgi:hypothetical protein